MGGNSELPADKSTETSSGSSAFVSNTAGDAAAGVGLKDSEGRVREPAHTCVQAASGEAVSTRLTRAQNSAIAELIKMTDSRPGAFLVNFIEYAQVCPDGLAALEHVVEFLDRIAAAKLATGPASSDPVSGSGGKAPSDKGSEAGSEVEPKKKTASSSRKKGKQPTTEPLATTTAGTTAATSTTTSQGGLGGDCWFPTEMIWSRESLGISEQHFYSRTDGGADKAKKPRHLALKGLSQWLFYVVSRGCLWEPTRLEPATKEFTQELGSHYSLHVFLEDGAGSTSGLWANGTRGSGASSTASSLKAFGGNLARDLAAWVQLTKGDPRVALLSVAYRSYIDFRGAFGGTGQGFGGAGAQWEFLLTLAVAGARQESGDCELALQVIQQTPLAVARAPGDQVSKGMLPINSLDIIWQPTAAGSIRDAFLQKGPDKSIRLPPTTGIPPTTGVPPTTGIPPTTGMPPPANMCTTGPGSPAGFEMFRVLASRCARFAEGGSRDKHRHGACLYLRLDELRKRDDQIGVIARTMTPEEAVICYGRNTEVFTKGWKQHNKFPAAAEQVVGEQDAVGSTGEDTTERWKVLHAEVDCLVQVVHDPLLVRFLSPVAKKDLALYAKDAASAVSISDVSSKVREIARLMEWDTSHDTLDEAPSGPLGVLVVELTNSGVFYSSAQACPLCIKGLKRWGIGEQIYSVPNPKLCQRERITLNEALVCESLRSALTQIGTQKNLQVWKQVSSSRKRKNSRPTL